MTAATWSAQMAQPNGDSLLDRVDKWGKVLTLAGALLGSVWIGSARITTLTDGLDTLSSNVTQLRGALAGLETRLSNVTTDVAHTQAAQIEKRDRQIEGIEREIGALRDASRQDADQLRTSVERLREQMSDAQNRGRHGEATPAANGRDLPG